MRSSQKTCVVLSGGGTKGVYHIGAWKALQEQGIEAQALVGSSIGAIMAAFIAQGAWDELAALGQSITIDQILKLPPELDLDGEIRLDRRTMKGLGKIVQTLATKGGIDTSPMRHLLERCIDEDAIRRSGVDLGIVTVSVTELRPCQYFLEDLEPGSLIDWLMASAAFPGFEQPLVRGKRFVDGGLYDNVPYAMARQRGYRNLIVIDIAGPGRERSPRIEGSTTTWIRASVPMGGALDFDPRFRQRYTDLGYLDTLRALGVLEGIQYFISPGIPALPEVDLAAQKAWAHLDHDRGRLPDAGRHHPDIPLVLLESAAHLVGIDQVARHDRGSLGTEILHLIHTQKESFEAGEYLEEPTLWQQVLRIRRIRSRRGRDLALASLRLLHPGLESGLALIDELT